ncbi:MAG: N-6 DNA methylase [Pseudonocardiaceae bacterium]
MNIDEQDHVTAAAIARRAGVGRAAVSNWRRRYADFPQAVGGSPSSPVFSWVQVEAWLLATGKAGRLVTAGRTDTSTQRIGDASPSNGGCDDLKVAPQERAVAKLTPGQLLARVMASLLPPPYTSASPSNADEPDGDEEGELPAVLDPACSDGALLLAVADRFGDHVMLVGQEIDEKAAALAAVNMRGHPLGAPYDIQTGDSLLDNQLGRYLGAAAAVVCEPPLDARQWPLEELAGDPRWRRFGVPEVGDAELAWVEHCYAHLRPRGVAVVGVSPRTSVRPSGQSVRAELVRSGVLRDVIALPKRMGSAPDTDMYLWVLQRPNTASDHAAVRMVDLSGLADPADVPHEFGAWQQLFDNADPAMVRAVPRLELLDGDTGLLPSRYVAPRHDAVADELVRLTSRLQALYTRIGRGFPRPTESTAQPGRAYVTLAELERVRALTIRSRDTTPRAGDVLLRTLSRPPVVADGGEADEVGIAQVVEIDATRLDAHFVTMFLRADANALPVANTHGAPSRDDLRRCRIPRMPVAEQRRYGEAFRHLLDLQGAVSALAAVSVNVLDQTIHGLTTGALTPRALTGRESIAVHATESEMSEQ